MYRVIYLRLSKVAMKAVHSRLLIKIHWIITRMENTTFGKIQQNQVLNAFYKRKINENLRKCKSYHLKRIKQECFDV